METNSQGKPLKVSSRLEHAPGGSAMCLKSSPDAFAAASALGGLLLKDATRCLCLEGDLGGTDRAGSQEAVLALAAQVRTG